MRSDQGGSLREPEHTDTHTAVSCSFFYFIRTVKGVLLIILLNYCKIRLQIIFKERCSLFLFKYYTFYISLFKWQECFCTRKTSAKILSALLELKAATGNFYFVWQPLRTTMDEDHHLGQ